MNKALYKIVGNGVIITPKVKRELDGLYRGWPAAQHRDTQREYNPKSLKHGIVKLILVFKR